MSKKIINYIVFPAIALFLLLLIAIPTATAAAETRYRDEAKPVLIQDMNPALSRNVKLSIGKYKEFDTPDIQVVSQDNTIYLMGKVGSEADRGRVESIARQVDGVDRIINELNIALPAADDQLTGQ